MVYTYSGNDTWTTWTCSTASTSSDNTWVYWTSDTSSSATTTTWTNWNYAKYDYQKMADNGTYQVKPIVYTEEQLAQQKAQLERLAAQRAEEERKAQEREKKAAEAREKSKQLLISLLDKQQAEDLEKKGSFGFVSDSGKVYTIQNGMSNNIIQQDGEKKTRLCCHIKDNVPMYDHMAAQLIWLKFCEDEFVKMANKTRM